MNATPETLKKLMILLILVGLIVPLVYSNPNLTFSSPTKLNGSILTSSQTDINVSVDEVSLDSFALNWDEVNYGVYDKSLVLSLNLDNNSLIAENSTKAVDISQYGNNGTFYGNSSWVSSGRFSGGASFRGGYISVPHSEIISGKSKSITVSVWVKPDDDYVKDSPNNVWIPIISKGANEYRLLWGDWAGYGVFFDAGVQNTNYAGYAVNLTHGNWYHLVGVFDNSTKAVKIYLDGELKTSILDNSEILGNNGTLKINDPSFPFNGTIDEVKIFDRALSDDEVSMLYKSIFTKKNSSSWNYYTNLTNFSTCQKSYYAWANNTLGDYNQTEVRTLNYPCVTPYSGIEIPYSATLCSGTYNLPATDIAVIKPKKSNIVITGNNTNIIGDANGYGVYLNGFTNVTIKNLNITNYSSSIVFNNAQNSTIDGIVSDSSNNSGIKIYSNSNFAVIKNSLIQKVVSYYHGIELSGANSQVINNTVRQVPVAMVTWSAGIFCNGNNNKIIDNYVETCDICIYTRSNSNITIENNTIRNATANSDGYDVGIFVFENAKNITIKNNSLEDIGSVGILIMKNATDISILNNKIDNYNLSRINETQSNDEYEPPAGIFIAEIYKKWTSDNSERSTDNISKISGYASRNIIISGNSFGSNIQVPLKTQGVVNLSQDLSNYWYRKIQLPTHLVDPDELYISNSTDVIKSFTWGSLKTNHLVGYGDVFVPSMNWMIYYRINSSVMEFRNYNDSVVYNISLFVPRFVLFNLSSLAGVDRVNVSLPVNRLWYHTINFTVTPSSGLVDVLVTDFGSGFVGWFENRSVDEDVEYDVCTFSPGVGVVYRVNGEVIDVYVANGSGCVNFERGGDTARNWMDLTPAGNGTADLSVTPSDYIVPTNGSRGDNMQLNVSVHNTGSASAGPFHVRYMDNSTILTTLRISNLSAGATTNLNYTWHITQAGAHSLWVAVDYNNSVSEADEQDNSVVGSITIDSCPVTLSEVVSLIIDWVTGTATLSNVIERINWWVNS